MRINNNMMAMNTHRQLGAANAGGAKSMEKLSSGMRINRAGDDAAGLAISEKMRGQIRGLNQASANSQDGISLIQTAEGALNETHAILQRMRELAVQSSTDTNTETDRAEIQKEVDQLASEITRIAETTEFNTQGLLNGDYKGKKFHIGANEGQDVTINIDNMDSESLKVAGAIDGKADYAVDGTVLGVGNDGTVVMTAVADFDKLAITEGENKLTAGKIDQVTVTNGSETIVANYGLTNDKGEVVAVSADGAKYTFLEEATKSKELGTAKLAVAAAALDFGLIDKVTSGEVSFTGTKLAASTLTDIKATASLDVEGLKSGDYTVATTATQVDFEKYFGGADGIKLGGTANLQAGDITSVLLDKDGKVVAVELPAITSTEAAAGKFFSVDSVDFTKGKAAAGTTVVKAEVDLMLNDAEVVLEKGSAGLATDKFTIKASGGGIDVSTQETASASITTINDAIETVSAERSKLGAMQNRLEHTIKNLDTSAENLQASEARIRDVDMAKEMMEQTKQNILAQASTAMLANANQSPQSVLQLLG